MRNGKEGSNHNFNDDSVLTCCSTTPPLCSPTYCGSLPSLVASLLNMARTMALFLCLMAAPCSSFVTLPKSKLLRAPVVLQRRAAALSAARVPVAETNVVPAPKPAPAGDAVADYFKKFIDEMTEADRQQCVQTDECDPYEAAPTTEAPTTEALQAQPAAGGEALMDEKLKGLGVSWYQALMVCFVAMVYAADGAEVTVMSLVCKEVATKFGLSEAAQGLLGMSVYTGMFTGGLVAGPIADTQGRSRTLLSATLLISVFGLASAYCPTFGLLCAARFIAGIGMGASLPVRVAYPPTARAPASALHHHRRRHSDYYLPKLPITRDESRGSIARARRVTARDGRL